MAGIKSLPYIGIMSALLKNPLKTFIEAAKEGDIVRLKIPGIKLFLIHNPEHIKHVFANDTVYVKGGQVKPFKKLFGTSVLTTEGDAWKRHRKIVQPAFHHQKLPHFARIFRDETLHMLDRWDTLPASQAEIDCVKEMKYLTQSIIVKTLFGTDLEQVKDKNIDQALDDVFNSLTRMIWSGGMPDVVQRMTGGKARADAFNHGLRVLHEVIATLIKVKRGRDSDQPDLLDMLLGTRFDDGSGLTEEQIRDEVITFFVAGHETTSVALSWAWIALARNPAIRAKLYAELDQIDHPLAFEDLPNLTYTRCIFYEALRTSPPAWFIPRTAKTSDVIAGTVIPSGSIMIASPYLAHRHPAFWTDPDTFEPERFRDNLRSPAHFYPFGYGGRQCIAKEFALMEGPLILGNVAKRYQLDLKYPYEPIEPNPGMTLTPKLPRHQGIPMLLRRR
ncbi:MAG TPA: cytochrome P450 [Herpetosiphonaceae bacterium]|nr:cytochrome P450 [Herpetosiphonaceae bacterium]